MAIITNSEDGDGALARLGKKPELKRRFGFWSLLGFATAELIIWESILGLLSLGFTNGGPAGLLYGFIISWGSSLSMYSVIAELTSMSPIAGGQYYWVYMLAPEKQKVFCSYIVGWLTVMAWIADIATFGIYSGTMVQGLMILQNPNYDAARWQGTLLGFAVIAVAILINVAVPAALPKFEVAVIVFHVIGFIITISVLWTYSPYHSAAFVFTTSINNGGWSSQGISYLVGYLGNLSIFVGADASVHMAEEVSNPAWNIPRAILLSIFFNGIIGIVTMLTILFCLGDVTSVLGTATGYPFLQVYLSKFAGPASLMTLTPHLIDSLKSVPGAIALGSIVTVMFWAGCPGVLTTASRVTWSFARDNATPFSSIIRKVDRRTQVPINAIIVVTTLAALLCVIYVGSYTAFSDIVSLTITGFYSSYLLPTAFLLYRRIKGEIAPHRKVLALVAERDLSESSSQTDSKAIHASGNVAIADSSIVGEKHATSQGTLDTSSGEVQVMPATDLSWGPWRIPGILGIINNAYALVYMVFVIFWSLWPQVTPVTAATMNYNVVVTGGVIIFSVIWYFVHGKKVYKGPTVDGEVAQLVLANHIN